MKYVVYNMAHGHSAIVSKDGCAWVRVLGFFNELQDAKAHAESCSGETRLWKVGPFKGLFDCNVSFMPPEEAIACLEYQGLKTSEKLQAWVLHREAQDLEVRTAANHKVMRDVTDVHVQAHVSDASRAPPSAVLPKAPIISRSMEIRAQQFALLAIVQDVEATSENASVRRSRFFESQWLSLNASAASQGLDAHAEVEDIEALEAFRKRLPDSSAACDVVAPTMRPQEPLVAFLQVGDTVEQLQEAINEHWSLLPEYTHADLAVVQMYEWIKPETASQNLKVSRTYRNEQMGQFKDIMMKSLRNEKLT